MHMRLALLVGWAISGFWARGVTSGIGVGLSVIMLVQVYLLLIVIIPVYLVLCSLFGFSAERLKDTKFLLMLLSRQPNKKDQLS